MSRAYISERALEAKMFYVVGKEYLAIVIFPGIPDILGSHPTIASEIRFPWRTSCGGPGKKKSESLLWPGCPPRKGSASWWRWWGPTDDGSNAGRNAELRSTPSVRPSARAFSSWLADEATGQQQLSILLLARNIFVLFHPRRFFLLLPSFLTVLPSLAWSSLIIFTSTTSSTKMAGNDFLCAADKAVVVRHCQPVRPTSFWAAQGIVGVVINFFGHFLMFFLAIFLKSCSSLVNGWWDPTSFRPTSFSAAQAVSIFNEPFLAHQPYLIKVKEYNDQTINSCSECGRVVGNEIVMWNCWSQRHHRCGGTLFFYVFEYFKIWWSSKYMLFWVWLARG